MRVRIRRSARQHGGDGDDEPDGESHGAKCVPVDHCHVGTRRRDNPHTLLVRSRIRAHAGGTVTAPVLTHDPAPTDIVVTLEWTSRVLQLSLVVVAVAWVLVGMRAVEALAAFAIVILGSIVMVVRSDRDRFARVPPTPVIVEPLDPATPIYVDETAIAMLAYGAAFPRPASLAG